MQGKNILVVGASSGVGLTLAKALSSLGANVYTASRTSNEELQAVSTAHQTLDVTQSIQLTGLPDVLHGLVYCPGTINLKPFHRLSEAEFRADFEVNVMGAVKKKIIHYLHQQFRVFLIVALKLVQYVIVTYVHLVGQDQIR